MDSYTKKAWGFVKSKLGELADMIPIVAKQVKVAVDNGDGTITDCDVCLMWSQEAAPGAPTWDEATAWAVNQAKWKFAVEYCKKRDIKFRIITEHSLFR